MQITSAPPVERSTAGSATTLRDAKPSAPSSSTTAQQAVPTDSFTSSVPAGRAVRSDRFNGEARICCCIECARHDSPLLCFVFANLARARRCPAKRSSVRQCSELCEQFRGGDTRCVLFHNGGRQELLRKRRRVGGTYVASVGNLPGASASGSTVQSAENSPQCQDRRARLTDEAHPARLADSCSLRSISHPARYRYLPRCKGDPWTRPHSGEKDRP